MNTVYNHLPQGSQGSCCNARGVAGGDGKPRSRFYFDLYSAGVEEEEETRMNEAERNGSCWQMDLGEHEDEEEAAVMVMVVAKAGELRRRQRASTQTLLAISSEWIWRGF